ncbi:hypothetical protein FLK61_37440 [Paenalkalicoccus suaedae]|uniref:Uncharacterized protein n=1 Tax=Paenalkalicoccus suaedae TaxID=2592382 RepID=A0A859FHP2_9BACI|nr:hypothetical protein [Paenalkalicoccus suaedae]QKS72320.1 hypothetical protein FLK61_37440 [Paenalkalicoccus suaedae]
MLFYEFKVAWCKLCNQGWIEIVKEKGSEKLLLQCSECVSQWDSVDYISNHIFKEDEVEVIEPTRKEIEKYGWYSYVLNE